MSASQKPSRYIKNYLDTFSGVRRYMEETVEFAQQHGYIETMFGRRRALPEIHSTNKNIVNFGKRVAMNTPIQGHRCRHHQDCHDQGLPAAEG